MTPIRLVARPLMASMFVMGGVNALSNSRQAAERAEPVADRVRAMADRVAPQVPVPTDPVTLVRVNAAAQIAAGLAFATGRAPRLSATVLAASLVPTTAAGHRFWEDSDPTARANNKIHFFKNLSMLGGLLLASVDTEGRPGVAWRARHAVRATRREARHLRREAKAQARLAAKSIGG